MKQAVDWQKIEQGWQRLLESRYRRGYKAGYQAALAEPATRLAKIALEQATIAQGVAELTQEPEADMSQMEDDELVKLIGYRGYQKHERELADKAFEELDRRYGVNLFARLGIC